MAPSQRAHGASGQGGWLEVAAGWRDRLQYGVLLPVLLVGGAGLVALGVPPPPTTGAMVAFYGLLGLAVVTGLGFALTAWRARLVVGPSGLVVRSGLRERLIPWNQLERVEVGPPHRYAGRRGRSARWQALNVRTGGAQLPVVVAATNRPANRMPELVGEVDRALAVYGHKVQRDER